MDALRDARALVSEYGHKQEDGSTAVDMPSAADGVACRAVLKGNSLTFLQDWESEHGHVDMNLILETRRRFEGEDKPAPLTWSSRAARWIRDTYPLIIFVVSMLLLGVLLGLVVGCSPPQYATLRLASLNMAGGAGAEYATTNARAKQAALAAALRPDIMSLQEVTDEALAALPPGHIFRVGEVAIWARTGITLDHTQEIPLDYGVWVDGVFVADRWPRAAAYARVSAPDIAITLSAVHLTATAQDQSDAERDPAPVRAVEMDEATVFDPDVVIGDFNALSKEIGETLGPLGYRAATRGAVDAVWLKTGEHGVMEPTGGASDHPAAVFVEIRRTR